MGGGSNVRAISECFIKPNQIVEESKKPFYMGSFELEQLSHCHLQIGLLFPKEEESMDSFMEKLKLSLSSTLTHFYPLAGQFVTEIDEDKHESLIYIDCNKGPGAKFIHATLDDVMVNDIVSPTYVPTTLVQSLFQLGKIPTNYDDHDEPLLVVQVTELVDGIFIGVSQNHCTVDGSSLWHFFSSWSEIFQSNGTKISRLPDYERWFPEGYGPIIKIPYIHPNQFITRYKTNEDDSPIREIIFYFSSESIEKLKAKSNEECGWTNKISSFQALSALIWRSIIRCRDIRRDESTRCLFVANARSRIKPSLSQNYFGCFAYPSFNSIRVSELLEKSLGSVASILHKAVQDFSDQYVRNEFIKWTKSPYFPQAVSRPDPKNIVVSGSHKEDAYEIEFGMGKPVALRTTSNIYNGKVVFRPTREGKGSVNLGAVCGSKLIFKNYYAYKRC